MAYILHIDTSDEVGLVALSKDGAIVNSITTTETRNHASSINVNIEQLLNKASIKMNNLGSISVCGGPGSYTGLRIGLATAKGLCYALELPLLMHNRLLLMAAKNIYQSANADDIFVTTLEARAGEYFIAVFDNKFKDIVSPKHILATNIDEIEKRGSNIQLIGHIDEQLTEYFSLTTEDIFNSKSIDLTSWAKYAYDQYICNSFVNLANSEPYYLKQVYTHKPKKTI